MTTKITHVAAGILLKPNGEFLLASRPEGKPYAGWWEFPGGKLEAGETALQALKRELDEELGIRVLEASPWVVQTFVYPHATVRLNFFKVTCWEGELQAHEGQQFAWQVPGATTVDPILPANTPILRGLQLPQIMAVSQAQSLGESLWLQKLDAALARGLKWLILREPDMDAGRYAALAARVLEKTRAAGARLLIHGDAALADRIGADGVHLPARMLLDSSERPAGWAGASVHNEDELQRAGALGLDYVLLGSVDHTASHPDGEPLGWDGFAALVELGWPLAVYGIGGMQHGDQAQAQAFGGQGIAMLSAAWRGEEQFV